MPPLPTVVAVRQVADPEPSVDALDRRDVDRAAGGDAGAFEGIYRRHHGALTLLARRLLGRSDVADVVHEVFVVAWRRLSTYRADGPLGAWLRRIAVRELIRARRAERRSEDRLTELDPAAALPARSRSGDIAIDLDRAIATLPLGARTAFVLHDIEGYSHDEIATITGTKPQTSRSQLCRARLLLRRFLEETDDPR
jgi:RNA polymerase sigma-70 factor (ECF subfamily)